MSTNAEKWRYFVRYANFCHLVPKVTETSGVISGVTGPIFNQNCTPVNQNCDVRIRVEMPKSVAMAKSLEELEKEVQIDKIHKISFIWWKNREIVPVDPEIIWLKLKKIRN